MLNHTAWYLGCYSNFKWKTGNGGEIRRVMAEAALEVTSHWSCEEMRGKEDPGLSVYRAEVTQKLELFCHLHSLLYHKEKWKRSERQYSKKNINWETVLKHKSQITWLYPTVS